MKKQVAVVQFDNGFHTPKNYNFLTNDETLVKGDKVVVDTQNGLAIANFIKFDELGFGETGPKTPTKWVIQKVDLSAHEARVEAEENMRKIKNQMIKKRKELEEVAIYQILAKEDPEMAALLEQMKALQEVL